MRRMVRAKATQHTHTNKFKYDKHATPSARLAHHRHILFIICFSKHVREVHIYVLLYATPREKMLSHLFRYLLLNRNTISTYSSTQNCARPEWQPSTRQGLQLAFRVMSVMCVCAHVCVWLYGSIYLWCSILTLVNALLCDSRVLVVWSKPGLHRTTVSRM